MNHIAPHHSHTCVFVIILVNEPYCSTPLAHLCFRQFFVLGLHCSTPVAYLYLPKCFVLELLAEHQSHTCVFVIVLFTNCIAVNQPYTCAFNQCCVHITYCNIYHCTHLWFCQSAFLEMHSRSKVRQTWACFKLSFTQPLIIYRCSPFSWMMLCNVIKAHAHKRSSRVKESSKDNNM